MYLAALSAPSLRGPILLTSLRHSWGGWGEPSVAERLGAPPAAAPPPPPRRPGPSAPGPRQPGGAGGAVPRRAAPAGGEGRGGPRGGRASAPPLPVPPLPVPPLGRLLAAAAALRAPCRPAGTAAAGPDGETRRRVPAARPPGDGGRPGAALLGAGVQLLRALRLHRRAAPALEHRPAAGRDLPPGGAGEPPRLPQRPLPGHPLLRPDQGEGEGGGGGSGPRGAHTRPCRAGQPCPPSGARVCTGSVRAPLRTPARPRAPAPLPLPLPPGSGAGLAGARRGAAQAGPGPAARGGSGARRAGGRGAGRLGGREGRRATPGVSQPACELRAPSRPAPPLFTACLVAGGSACRASGWRGERSAQGEAPSPRWCD